jgi:hypothetical protein
MSSAKAIVLSYALSNPPLKTAAPQNPMTQEISFPMITLESSSTYASFYASSSAAVLQAQRDLNEHLTAWKDAIGDAEKVKEDMGQVEYGKGKAARMMQYAAGREAQVDVGEDSEEETGGAE